VAPERAANEVRGLLERLARAPGHPLGEVRAVAVDEPVQLLRIRLLEHAEVGVVVDLEPHRA